MVMEITQAGGAGGTISDDLAPINLANTFYARRSMAQATERASHEVAGDEFSDITSSETIAVRILDEDAELVEFEVHQSASDDGTSASQVDLLADGSSILDSKVTLDDSSETEQTATISTTDQSDGTVLEIDVDGGSDDASPPRVYAQVVYRYVKDKFTNPNATV